MTTANVLKWLGRVLSTVTVVSFAGFCQAGDEFGFGGTDQAVYQDQFGSDEGFEAGVAFDSQGEGAVQGQFGPEVQQEGPVGMIEAGNSGQPRDGAGGVSPDLGTGGAAGEEMGSAAGGFGSTGGGFEEFNDFSAEGGEFGMNDDGFGTVEQPGVEGWSAQESGGEEASEALRASKEEVSEIRARVPRVMLSEEDAQSLSKKLLRERLENALASYEKAVSVIRKMDEELLSLEQKLVEIRKEMERIRADAKSKGLKIIGMRGELAKEPAENGKVKKIAASALTLLGEVKNASSELQKKKDEAEKLIDQINRLERSIRDSMEEIREDGSKFGRILDALGREDAHEAKRDEEEAKEKIEESAEGLLKRERRDDEEQPSSKSEKSGTATEQTNVRGAFKMLLEALNAFVAGVIRYVAKFIHWITKVLFGKA